MLPQEGFENLRVTQIPLRFSESGLPEKRPAANMGAHNEEVYGTLGYSPEAVADLRKRGII